MFFLCQHTESEAHCLFLWNITYYPYCTAMALFISGPWNRSGQSELSLLTMTFKESVLMKNQTTWSLFWQTWKQTWHYHMSSGYSLKTHCLTMPFATWQMCQSCQIEPRWVLLSSLQLTDLTKLIWYRNTVSKQRAIQLMRQDPWPFAFDIPEFSVDVNFPLRQEILPIWGMELIMQILIIHLLIFSCKHLLSLC